MPRITNRLLSQCGTFSYGSINTAVDGHIKWSMTLENGGHLNIEARDFMMERGAGESGSIVGAAEWLAGEKVASAGLKALGRSGARLFASRSASAVSEAVGSPFDGVRAASKYLREQGVPRVYRKQILQSFETETISLRTADNATFGLRFYGGTADQSGRFLFPTFSNFTNRAGLALPTNWGNSMSGIAQFQIAPGSTYIFGRAASQGGIYSGGSYQMYINNLKNLIK